MKLIYDFKYRYALYRSLDLKIFDLKNTLDFNANFQFIRHNYYDLSSIQMNNELKVMRKFYFQILGNF
jgi:hypothetical protein